MEIISRVAIEQQQPARDKVRARQIMARLHAFLSGSVVRSRVLSGRTSYTFGSVFLEKRGGST